MIHIKCCRDCVAPKRHVGCHDTCPEYIKEKKQLDEHNARVRAQRLKESAWPELRKNHKH